MKLNLMFKGTAVENNQSKDVVKVVEVNLPDELKGYKLVGSADCIRMIQPPEQEVGNNTTDKSSNVDSENNQINLESFESSVGGTARLSRYKGIIRIGYRRGTKSHNITRLNSVCIDNFTKQHFFDETRNEDPQFSVSKKDNLSLYQKWSNFMDEEYKRQKQIYLDKLVKSFRK